MFKWWTQLGETCITIVTCIKQTLAIGLTRHWSMPQNSWQHAIKYQSLAHKGFFHNLPHSCDTVHQYTSLRETGVIKTDQGGHDIDLYEYHCQSMINALWHMDEMLFFTVKTGESILLTQAFHINNNKQEIKCILV